MEPVNPMGFTAGGSGGDLGRNLRNITRVKESQNILLSNSFENLNEDLMEPETREMAMAISPEENKETQLAKGPHNNEISVSGNSESMVDGFKGKGGNGAKRNSKERWSGKLKPLIRNGPRTKAHSNKPTRGLMFGPTEKEIELSASGKRLRVREGHFGRPGGAYGIGNEAGSSKSKPIQHTSDVETRSEAIQKDVENERERMAPNEHISSSERMEMVVA